MEETKIKKRIFSLCFGLGRNKQKSSLSFSPSLPTKPKSSLSFFLLVFLCLGTRAKRDFLSGFSCKWRKFSAHLSSNLLLVRNPGPTALTAKFIYTANWRSVINARQPWFGQWKLWPAITSLSNLWSTNGLVLQIRGDEHYVMDTIYQNFNVHNFFWTTIMISCI